MGDLRPNNGGGVPPDDGSAAQGGLPDLPPEWGDVVIPDDAAELDAEASAVRRELRHHALRTRLRALGGLGPGRRGDAPSIGIPLVIMAVAVITTLLSLFVVTWDHRRNATAPVGPEAGSPGGAVPIADVMLADAIGSRVKLGNLLPAVLLLVGDCDCKELINAVASAAPAIVTVVPVGTAAPCSVGTARNVRCLADPSGAVTERYPSPAEALAAKVDATAGTPPSTPTRLGPSALPPTSVAPIPMALAVPVDADGAAHEAILVLSAGDLAAALAVLTTTG
jgi:hypothetical protein